MLVPVPPLAFRPSPLPQPWAIICPDNVVRHPPYLPREMAEEDAVLCAAGACSAMPHALKGYAACPGGPHRVRPADRCGHPSPDSVLRCTFRHTGEPWDTVHGELIKGVGWRYWNAAGWAHRERGGEV